MSACEYNAAKNGLKLHIVNSNEKLPSILNPLVDVATSSSSVVTTAATAPYFQTTDDTSESASTSSSSLILKKIKTPLNVGFNDLKFTVKVGMWKNKDKVILNGMNGEFRAGDLTAIMGSSGTGKSTLLDILSGYTSKNVTGEITINGEIRDAKKFRRQSAYIMQDHEIQPLLTVMEAMYFSASLKIGDDKSRAERKIIIKQILLGLGLYECRKTRSGSLSGGQKKRLAIALELVNNPPVMFFDEPTSGLDSSTAIQVVSILRKMTREGRTIVCTIHQPSFKTFHMFDKLYTISKGHCIYQGPVKELVSFLDGVGVPCPSYHDPADFLMDLANGEYDADFDTLTSAALNKYYVDKYKYEVARQRLDDEKNHNERLADKKAQHGENYAFNNGKHHTIAVTTNYVEQLKKEGIIRMSCDNNTKDTNLCDTTIINLAKSEPMLDTSKNQFHKTTSLSLSQSTLEKVVKKSSTMSATTTKLGGPSITDPQLLSFKQKKSNLQKLNPRKFCKRDERYATTFCRQSYLLLMRSFIILRRDKSMTRMRLLVHCLIGSLIGVLYQGIGNDASQAFNNFNYIFFSIMFLMFTAFSSVQMQFPLELPIITREHFNRWYSLRAYYLAMTLADVPIQICCTLVYTLITYFMTSQPLEFYRFGLFTAICLMVTFVAQAYGSLVGSLFDVKNGTIWGTFFISPFLIFSGFFIHLTDAHPLLHWLFHISYLKYALEGAVLAIFGYDRERMDCFEDYCHFILPKKLLKTIDMEKGDYVQATLFLISMMWLFRIVAFYIMNFRLKYRNLF